MNAVVNSSIDHSPMQGVGSQKQASAVLKDFISDLGLTDTYRALYPTSREYTFQIDTRHTQELIVSWYPNLYIQISPG